MLTKNSTFIATRYKNKPIKVSFYIRDRKKIALVPQKGKVPMPVKARNIIGTEKT